MPAVVALTRGGSLLDDLPVAVALLGADGRIGYVNAAAVARYGWRSAESVLGMSAAVLGEGLAEHVAPGSSWRGELPAPSADGTFIAAFEVGPWHEPDGAVAGSVVVCLDASRRAEAEQAAERLARLQAATARLGGASSVEDVANAVCDHGAAGVGAQAAALWQIVDDGAALELVRHIGMRGVEERWKRLPADAAVPIGDALRTRSVVVVQGALDRAIRYPSLAPSGAHETVVVVPLLRDGRPVGAVAFGFRRAHAFGTEDHRFVLALSDQAGQALLRVRQDAAERASRQRQELLARATGVLAGIVAPETAAAAVGRLVVQELADSFSVLLGVPGDLRLTAAVNADPELEELTVATFATPAGARMRRYIDGLVSSSRSVLTEEVRPEQWEELLGDRTAAETMRALDISSVIAVGLHAGGRRLGLLAVTRGRARRPFDQDDFVVVTDLAGRLAAAIDAAQAHQARAEVARTLQASLLPPRLPDIPGVVLASRYDPIGDGSLVGGDFYDAFPVGHDRWCLVLGDVCGQGVDAAALTSLVRYTVRAAARMWSSPAQILRFTNDAILDHDTGERFCTALVCVLQRHPSGVEMHLAAAGHHLPLHRAVGREPVAVGATGTALGLVRVPELHDTIVVLHVGDVLVLTTDGVIEARDAEGTPVDEGFLEHLVSGHADDGAEALAAAIQRAVLAVGGGRARDDAAVVVVEVTAEGPTRPIEAPAGGPFETRYEPTIAAVTDARRSLAVWLEREGIGGPRVPDLLLATTELATNAVRAARTVMEVRAWLTPDAVMVEVTDDGAGFDPEVPRSARQIDPLAERGRGLFLVAALVEECTIESGPNGTIVRCYVSR